MLIRRLQIFGRSATTKDFWLATNAGRMKV